MPTTMPSAMPDASLALLWFFAIVAAIPLVLWLLRRTPLGGLAQPRAGTPRLVASLSVAPQSRVVTVEVGEGDDRLWLVLGVTAQGIRTLHTMVPLRDSTDPPPPPAVTFAQLLGRLKKDPDAPG